MAKREDDLEPSRSGADPGRTDEPSRTGGDEDIRGIANDEDDDEFEDDDDLDDSEEEETEDA